MPLVVERQKYGPFHWQLLVRQGEDILPLPDIGFATKREAQAAHALLLPLGNWEHMERFTPKQLAQVRFALASLPCRRELQRRRALVLGSAKEEATP